MAQHPQREAFLRTHNWKSDEITVQEEGTFWLVKSSDVHIQAHYQKNQSHPEFTNLGAIAVGGPFLEDNVLVFRPLDETVTWNDKDILSSLPSTFSNGFVTATYRKDAELVKNGGKAAGIDVILPKGVKLTVNRWKHNLAAKISMCKEEGQDGQCGNFNSDHTDDRQDELMARVGQQLPPQENLFERYGKKGHPEK